MTWLEFKRWMEEQGVTDETEIDYIDFEREPTAVYMHKDGIGVT